MDRIVLAQTSCSFRRNTVWTELSWHRLAVALGRIKSVQNCLLAVGIGGIKHV